MAKYDTLIARVFFDNYKEGCESVLFSRDDLEDVNTTKALNIKNLGDVLYSYLHRKPLPSEIINTAPQGRHWTIRHKGKSEYAFELTRMPNITPTENLITIKIPDSTPEIISAATRNDEQALLAKVRYNRLIDIFLGLTSYSLQSHLRTSVPNIGQVEVDEIYIAIDQNGRQYVIPVEAKGCHDELGIGQIEHGLAVCKDGWSDYIPIAIGIQFMTDDTIVMFELTMQDEEVRVVKERRYQLVPSAQITEHDRKLFASLARDRVY